jgi:hypothetical protein
VIDSALYSAFALANFEPLELHVGKAQLTPAVFGHNTKFPALLERKMGSSTKALLYHLLGGRSSGKTQENWGFRAVFDGFPAGLSQRFIGHAGADRSNDDLFTQKACFRI